MRTAIAYNRNRRDARIEESGRRRATVRSGAAMTWEWEHRNNRGQWVLTVGTWHAVVQRLAGSRPLWQAILERTTLPHERYASQAYPKAVDARTWCLPTIGELASTAA